LSGNNEYGDLAVLDLTTLLEAFGEIGEDAKHTMRLFVGHTRALLDAITERLDAGDLAGASESAHAAKGAANMTGTLRLGALCGDIDRALRAGDASAARQKLASLPAIFTEAETEIRKIAG
jgi:HPt (histidine-containing phosphotransfer) domain-containing protein